MPRRPCRTIVETEQFASELQDLVPNARRADEFIDAAKILLSRHPHQGHPISLDPPVYFLPINHSKTVTDVVLYYTFTSTEVFFLSIREAMLK
jgi:hypothetical protein